MSDDWNTVTVLRGKQAKPGAAKSSQAVNAARRRGEAVSTEQKYGAGGNKHGGTTLNTAKLDRETEELKHQTVSMDVGKLIQQGRQAKVMSQIFESSISIKAILLKTLTHPNLIKKFSLEFDPKRVGNQDM